MPESDYKKMKAKLKNNEEISFYAADASGLYESSQDMSDISSSVGSLHNGGETNAVTWGTFPGKEIITPTIVEEVSFRAWAEEAFGIWEEWERVYERGSKSKEVIRGCREGYWLVNIIHHAFVEKEALWQFILDN